MKDFAIYEGFTGKHKKYIVTKIDADCNEVWNFAKRFFKCSETHIDFVSGWLYKGELYLDNPKKYGAKKVGVAYYV